jgi:16S rRNA (adenine1518-N6/adenine1519-N6)-dimethyltransferase
MPAPKVNSAVIRLKLRDNPPVEVSVRRTFSKWLSGVFPKAQNALNCLSNGLGLSKAQVTAALEKIGRNSNDRAEKFTMEELAALAELL